jgi:hypothetical protein
MGKGERDGKMEFECGNLLGLGEEGRESWERCDGTVLFERVAMEVRNGFTVKGEGKWSRKWGVGNWRYL